jgi:SAM-dependent methyltransferase
MYIPVRAANAHAALRDIPVALSEDGLSDYTFVDMGSGKGRMLFVAAEYPFHKVVGVEFSLELHEEAVRNIQRYISRKRRCGEIEAVLADAAAFPFPEGKLVVYLFNPFGPEVMGRMLENLAASLQRNPRHVVILLIWPECGELVSAMPGAREVKKTRRHQVYEFGAK